MIPRKYEVLGLDYTLCTDQETKAQKDNIYLGSHIALGKKDQDSRLQLSRKSQLPYIHVWQIHTCTHSTVFKLRNRRSKAGFKKNLESSADRSRYACVCTALWCVCASVSGMCPLMYSMSLPESQAYIWVYCFWELKVAIFSVWWIDAYVEGLSLVTRNTYLGIVSLAWCLDDTLTTISPFQNHATHDDTHLGNEEERGCRGRERHEGQSVILTLWASCACWELPLPKEPL